MSTRAVVNFYDTYNGKPHLRAKVYRHSDGYPEGLGKDLKEFLALLKKTVKDTRFGDASYLAAKWVVHDSERGNYRYETRGDKYERVQNESRLDFLGVGIIMEDPGDIDYSYDVICDSSINKNVMPKIKHKEV